VASARAHTKALANRDEVLVAFTLESGGEAPLPQKAEAHTCSLNPPRAVPLAIRSRSVGTMKSYWKRTIRRPVSPRRPCCSQIPAASVW